MPLLTAASFDFKVTLNHAIIDHFIDWFESPRVWNNILGISCKTSQRTAPDVSRCDMTVTLYPREKTLRYFEVIAGDLSPR